MNMQIVKTGDEKFHVMIAPAEGGIFINCMNEAEKALGARAFPSRFGGKFDEVKALFSAIEAALK
ncbi:MAG TPA: hypothetical protein VFC38_07080 [Stellaceae bacterium]|nr:hypothetical protein [Stellaceae bacterium]